MILQPASSPRATAACPKRGQHGPIVDLPDLTPDVRGHPPDTGADVGGFNGDIVDEWGRQSFPASDPPANWRRIWTDAEEEVNAGGSRSWYRTANDDLPAGRTGWRAYRPVVAERAGRSPERRGRPAGTSVEHDVVRHRATAHRTRRRRRAGCRPGDPPTAGGPRRTDQNRLDTRSARSRGHQSDERRAWTYSTRMT
jgi:hypothetical protein